MSIANFTGNANSDIYISELRGAYAGMRLFDPDYALAEDPDVKAKMLRDPIILAGVQGRTRGAAGFEWRLEPPRKASEKEKELCDIAEFGLSELDSRGEFRRRRLALAEGILDGQSFAWIRGEREMRDFGDGKPRLWWIPNALTHMDKRRVRQTVKRGESGRFNEEDPTRWEYAPLNVSAELWEPLDIRNVVMVTFEDSESRLGKGRGLAEALYWTFYAKVRTLEYVLNWSERWSEGMGVAKIDLDKPSDTATTTAARRDEWLATMKKMRARHNLVFSKDDEFELLESSGVGPDKLLQQITYFDNVMTRLIRGALLPSGGGADVGSNARAGIEQGSEDTITEFDRCAIDDAITAGVVAQFLRLNKPHLNEMGLSAVRSPRFVTTSRQRPDHTEATNRATALLDRGVDLVKEDVYQQTGFRQPTEEDEIIEGGAPGSDILNGFTLANRARKPHKHKGTAGDDVFIPSAFAYAINLERSEGSGDYEPTFPWEPRAFKRLRDAIRRMAKRVIDSVFGDGGPDRSNEQELEAIGEELTDAMTAADLEGRAETLEDASDVAGEELEPSPDFMEDFSVPKIEFGESTKDILRRKPVLARSAISVAKAYRDGPAFAAAHSVSENITKAMQQVVVRNLKDGILPEQSIDEIVETSDNITRSYAETVLRTNVSTARTEGRFSQMRDPVLKRATPALMFTDSRDPFVRRGREGDHGENHSAAHGLIAAPDDPIWLKVAPPLGYNCRCDVSPVSRFELKRRGLLDENGQVIPFYPAGLDALKPHPNFRRSRMPGA